MSTVPFYKDPQQPIDVRVDDLLQRMTLEEKIGQLMQLDGRDNPVEDLQNKHVGSFLHMLGEKSRAMQQMALESRLGIPLLFGIDAIHGHSFWKGATMFPTQLGMACSWNPDLLEKAARVTALEMCYTGMHWTFSPVLCLARDLRWGRINETFGEDAHLIGVLASAMIRGYQGNDISEKQNILACAKHFVGYSETQGGRDSSEADIPTRKLRSTFFPPFELAAQAGCKTFMTGYQAIDGVPCTANRWLLTDVLREEWGFDGFVITDWQNVDAMVNNQRVFPNMEEASTAAVAVGNDMIMNSPDFFDAMLKQVEAGKVDPNTIDQACKRILHIKFEMGLFENPRFPDEDKANTIVGCSTHRNIALQTSLESIVLLKNEEQVLPLNIEENKRLAVIGPNANNPLEQLGDWSLGTGQAESGQHPRSSVVTILDGIMEYPSCHWEVTHAPGCQITDSSSDEIAEAVQIANAADVTLLVLGDQLPYVGEAKSTATLELMGAQNELFQEIRALGKPLIVVLINSKPLAIPHIAENADALIEAWNPGSLGGTALAKILFGDANPSGKLTISFPHHVGQLPVWYNQYPGQHGDSYADLTQEPLFAFGYGLSYTTYAYENLSLSSQEITTDSSLTVQVDVSNTGEREGSEVVQLYLNDLVTSVTTPIQELKAFRKIKLAPGEKQTVSFDLTPHDLSLITVDQRRHAEPGEFEVMVGSSSRSSDLLKARFWVK